MVMDENGLTTKEEFGKSRDKWTIMMITPFLCSTVAYSLFAHERSNFGMFMIRYVRPKFPKTFMPPFLPLSAFPVSFRFESSKDDTVCSCQTRRLIFDLLWICSHKVPTDRNATCSRPTILWCCCIRLSSADAASGRLAGLLDTSSSSREVHALAYLASWLPWFEKNYLLYFRFSWMRKLC